jgi:beta-lactamase regulating signal transducer with metallopeptidase domain
MTAATMVLPLAFSVAVKATLILGGAAAVDYALRRKASAASRHFLWSVTLGALLLLPLLVVVLPTLRLPVLPPVDSEITLLAPDSPHQERAVNAQPADWSSQQRSAQTQPATATKQAAPLPWKQLALLLYFGGTLLLLVRIAGEQVLVRRLAARSERIDSDEWLELLQISCRLLHVERPVQLLRSAAPIIPLTWGVRRAWILLPATADDWPAERRRAVLLHELAHVARRDCLIQMAAAITCALYWPHPGVWWAARRLRAERELACDDAALNRGIPARGYARHLLEVAHDHYTPRRLSAVAVSMASLSIEQRLRALIDTGRVRTPPGKRAMLLATLLAAVLLLPMSALRVVAADSQSERALPEAGDAQRSASNAPVDDVTRKVNAVEPTPLRNAAPEQTVTAPDSVTGHWRIRLAGKEESPEGVKMVHVTLFTPGLTTFYVQLDSVQSETSEKFLDSDSKFRGRLHLKTEPGWFKLEGSSAQGSAQGTFTFYPHAEFASELVDRGMERPTARQQFDLARHRVGLAFLDALAELGYSQPSTDELVRASFTGADLDYVRTLARLGYRLGSLSALVSLSNAGITPAFIEQANTRAGRKLSVAELIQQHNRSREPATETVGTSPATTPYNGRWVVKGIRGDNVDLELQWVDNTQWRRWYSSAELALPAMAFNAPLAIPVSFTLQQDAGSFDFNGMLGAGQGSGDFVFKPRREFVDVLKSLGVVTNELVTDHQLKNLAFGGMSTNAIREFKALGLANLQLEEVVRLAIYKVTPDYLRTMMDHRVSGISTASDLIDLRIFSVPREYVGSLASFGYNALSARQLIDLWRARVSATFIADLQSGGQRDLSPDVLIELKKRAEQSARRRD